MRRIDLICKILAPVVAGLLLSATDPLIGELHAMCVRCLACEASTSACLQLLLSLEHGTF